MNKQKKERELAWSAIDSGVLSSILLDPAQTWQPNDLLTSSDQVSLSISQSLGRLGLVTVSLLHHELDITLVNLDGFTGGSGLVVTFQFGGTDGIHAGTDEKSSQRGQFRE